MKIEDYKALRDLLVTRVELIPGPAFGFISQGQRERFAAEDEDLRIKRIPPKNASAVENETAIEELAHRGQLEEITLRIYHAVIARHAELSGKLAAHRATDPERGTFTNEAEARLAKVRPMIDLFSSRLNDATEGGDVSELSDRISRLKKERTTLDALRKKYEESVRTWQLTGTRFENELARLHMQFPRLLAGKDLPDILPDHVLIRRPLDEIESAIADR